MSSAAKPELEPGQMISSWLDNHEPGTTNPDEITILREQVFEPLLALGIHAIGVESFIGKIDILEHILTTTFPESWDKKRHGWDTASSLVAINKRINTFMEEVGENITLTLIAKLRARSVNALQALSATHMGI